MRQKFPSSLMVLNMTVMNDFSEPHELTSLRTRRIRKALEPGESCTALAPHEGAEDNLQQREHNDHLQQSVNSACKHL